MDIREKLKKKYEKQKNAKRILSVMVLIIVMLATMKLTGLYLPVENLIKYIREAKREEIQETSENTYAETSNAIAISLQSEVASKVEPKIEGGNNHFIALTAEGKVYGWGLNNYGQLATKNTETQKEPVYMGIDNAVDIAAGDFFNVVLKEDGTVWTIGNNEHGQLGNGTQEDSNIFVQVKDETGTAYLSNVKSIAAGNTFAFAITNSNEVYAWGLNNYGQLGVGDTTLRTTATKTLFNDIIQIKGGENHSVAVASNGSVWGVGYNKFGQLATGNTTNKSTPVQMLASGAAEVAAGANHTMILKTDGTVWATGYNGNSSAGTRYYILGTGTSSSTGYNAYVANSSGGNDYYRYTLRQVCLASTTAYITDGRHIVASGNTTYITTSTTGMYTIGTNSYGALFSGNTSMTGYSTKKQSNKKIIAMAVTKNSATGAIADDIGRIYTVGYSANGELGNGTTATSYGYIPYSISDYKLIPEQNIVNMVNGSTQKLNVNLSTGLSLANSAIELNVTYTSLDESIATVEADTITAVSCGTTYIRVGDTINGVYGSIKVNVTENGGINYAKIVGGNNHFISQKIDGTVWTWGLNDNGQLGLGDNINKEEPTKIDILQATDIAAGSSFSAILKNDGTVWTTGDNTYGQLGDGTTDSRNTFAMVEGLTDVIAITAEDNTMHALKSDGTVWSWGLNSNGQLGNQTTTNSAIPVKVLKVPVVMQIAGGGNHLIMQGADGSVWGVGYNIFGQLGLSNVSNQTIPQRMLASGAKEVAAGANHTMVLNADGTVWATGYNGNSSAGTRYYILGTGTSSSTGYNAYVANSSGGNDYYRYTLRQVCLASTTAYITDGRHIVASGNTTYITTSTTGMYTIGTNSYGALFSGNTSMTGYSTKKQSNKKIIAMAVTKNSATGAIADKDGMVYTVGYNKNNEMGNKTTENLLAPVCISSKKINVSKNIIDFKLKGETEKINYTVTMKYNLLQDDVPQANLSFTSLDENIATVSSDGTVIAEEIGTTYIELADTTNSIYQRIKINVNGETNITQPKIVGGTNHFVALKADGTVWTWGLNDQGQLGLGNIETTEEPTKTNMKNVIDIAAGAKFTAILRKDGTVWTTGYNNYGQLGDGTKTNTETFHKVKLNDNGDYLENIVQITAENETMHALSSEGIVYSWGRNTEGQFGTYNTQSSDYPVQMLKVSNVTQISGGAYHIVMVLADSSVWAAGYNKYGQLGLGNLVSQTIPQRMLTSGAKEVAAGANHTIVLKTDGTVWATGYNGTGNQGNQYYVLGLGGSGTSFKDGDITDASYSNGTSRYVYKLRQVKLGNATTNITGGKHITASGNVTYVSTANGMYTFGQNSYGNLFTGNTTQNYWATNVQKDKTILAMAITKDSATGAIADQDGMVYTVGYNTNGEIGNGTTENLTSAICISNKKINVTKNIINLENVGDTEQITYTTGMTFNLLLEAVPGTECTYKSIDETVATVDETGMVTAVGIGTTYIQLYNEENAMYASVKVNVNGELNITQPKIVGGGNHFIALKADGTVWTWGLNSNGQLGIGNTDSKNEPTKAKYAKVQADGMIVEEELTDVIDVAAGYNFSLVLKVDGTVWATGLNEKGQLGNGTTDNSKVFMQVKGENGVGYLKDIIQITAENETSHALTKTNIVYSWGRNTEGQFGNATKTNSNYPVQMLKISNVTQISGGAYHIVMILADSSVWATGYNKYGQLGLGNLTNQTIPQRMLTSGAKEVATGANHTIVLKTDGTVWATGYNGTGNQGNQYYVLGLGGSGTSFKDGDITDASYGNGTSRYVYKLRQVKLGNASTNITGGKHITASGNVTYVSTTNGMYTFGQNNYGNLFTGNTTQNYWATNVQKDKTILAMAITKNSATGAIADQDGMVYTVGYNVNGEIGNATNESLTSLVCISNKKINVGKGIINFEKAGNTEQITYTTTMSFNLIQDVVPGTLKCTYTSLDESIATVDEQGIVTAVGVGTTYIQLCNEENAMYSAVKINVNGESNIVQPKIVGGGNHFISLKADGTVWTWGLNSNGQLGIGNTENKNEPTKAKYAKVQANGTIIEELTDVIDVAAGYNFSLVLKSNGTVWATGLNEKGQLGNGTANNSNIFVQVKDIDGVSYLEGIVQLTAGNETSYALSKSGTVYAWGRNTEGQFGNSTTINSSYPVQMLKISNVMQISAGANHIAMLQADSSVWVTGYNKYGQLGLGNLVIQTLPQRMLASGAKEVATGANHTIVLKTDGSVWATGYNGTSNQGNQYYVLGLGGSGSSYKDGDFSDTSYSNGTSRYVYKLRQVKLGNASTNITEGKHITASGNVTYVSTTSGMYTLGQNSYGNLFTGNTTQNYWATNVQKDKEILAMAITKNSATGAIADQDGMVYTVGYNKNGEMGNADTVTLTSLACISNVKLIPTPLTINYKKVGDTGTQITYIATASFNLLKDTVNQGSATYTSLDKNVATVDEIGIVTATGLGTTYVRLYNDSTDTYTSIKVNVNGDEGKIYPKIVAGANHFVALRANGEVWTWGYNGYGNLGLGNNTTTTKPTKTSIYDSSNETQEIYAVDVAAGGQHTLVLKSDGTVWASGYNNYGQLGDGTTKNQASFVQVKNAEGNGYLTNVIAVAAGNTTSYALLDDGSVYGWGYNGYGNLGIGSNDENAHSIPRKVSRVENIMQITSGNNHLLMVGANGTVWGVGYNQYGQLGLGNNTTKITVPAQMKQQNGTGVLTGVKEVSAGEMHTLIALENGNALSVGYNKKGQLGLNNRTNINLPQTMKNTSGTAVTNVKSVSANGNSSLVSVDKGIYVTGYNAYGQLFTKDKTQRTGLTLVQQDKNIIAMAATTNSSYQTSAIADSYGIVYTVGYNVHGEIGDDTTITTVNPVIISESSLQVEKTHMILNLDSINSSEQIKAETTVGFNLLYYKVEEEELTYKSLDTDIATVANNGLVSAQKFGTTKIEVTTNKLTNRALVTVDVINKDDVAMPKIVRGSEFAVALRADGTVWTWGLNSNGQLGTSDTSNKLKPTQINITNVIDIAAGDTHAMLLTKDGYVYTFGSNGYGQLGRSGSNLKPMKVEGLENIVEIAASTYSSMALNNEGQVYTWGYNGKGQLGDNTTVNKSVPTKIKISNILTIAGFNQNSAAVTHDGELYVWGYNKYGQLGLGNTTDKYTPTKITSISGIVDVAVENNTIIALDENGYVWSSGYNQYGNLGNNSTTKRSTFGKVLSSNGAELTDVKYVEAGNEYAIAVKNDGTAVVWGQNAYGQFATGNTTAQKRAIELKYSSSGNIIDGIIDVSAGANTISIVRSDGKVWSNGRNNCGQIGDSSVLDTKEFVCISKSRISVKETPIRLKGLNKSVIPQVDIIYGFNLLYSKQSKTNYEYTIKNTEVATAQNDGLITSVKKGKTQLTIKETISNERTTVDVYVLGDEDLTFPQIESTQYSTVTLKANGEVWSYGRNNYGQLGTGDANDKILPTYTGINNIMQISLGEEHALALDANGHVWAWGNNNYGQLGNGTTNTSYTNVQVKSPDGLGMLENIVAVAAGNSYSLALDKDGQVYAWGYNNYGQLGMGDTTSRNLPILVQSLEKIIKIEAGNYSSYAIDSEDNLWVAGYNGYGNLGDGTTTNKAKFEKNSMIKNVAEISSGESDNTLALLLDGTVWGVGRNANYALTNVGGAIPQQLQTTSGKMNNITAIHAGFQTGYAITSDEKVLVWGRNDYAQLATGNKTNQSKATYMKDKNGNDITNVMIVSGGKYNTEIAKNDGTVWSIGYNQYGQLGDASNINRSNLVCISSPYVQLADREVLLKLSNPNYQINPITTYGFNLLYDVAENNGFTYESSHTDIASVDTNSGLVTASKIGRTYITVKSNNGEDETRIVIDVIGEENITSEKVATGRVHSLALKQNGTVWAWGDNSKGEIGNGVANSYKVTKPTQVNINNITDIAAGYYYNLAVDVNGYVYSWGYNAYGQLGDGTTKDQYNPIKINGLENIKKVYICENVSLAINVNGEIFAWGKGYSTIPTKISFYNKAIQVTDKLILAEDGTVWNLADTPTKIAGLTNIVQIASDSNCYIALDTKGNVYGWGYNKFGQLGQGHNSTVNGIVKIPVNNVVEISTGRDNINMTTKDGKVYSCGYNAKGQLGIGNYTTYINTPTEAININNNKLVSIDYYHSVISDKLGFVYTTGLNDYGELANENLTTRNTYSIIGDTYVYVNSKVVTIEKNNTYKLEASLNNEFNLIQDVIDDSNIEYKSLNEDIAVVNSDGTITAKEYGKVEIIVKHTVTNKTAIVFVNVVPDGKSAVPEVQNSYTHTVALKADGTVWTWGNNDYGQLGIGNTNTKASPVQITNLENIIDISVGYNDTIAIKNDGTVWSFGYNRYGQLGDGTTTNRVSPVQVIKEDGSKLTNIVKVAGGTYKTVALDSDGNVWIWGYGYAMTAKKLTAFKNIIDISSSYVVDKDGNVLKIEDATKLSISNILRVSEGDNHTLFLTKDAKGYSLGNNEKGQLGIGNTKNSDIPKIIKDETGTGELTNIKELSAGKEFSMALLKDGSTYVWGSNENYKLATNQNTNQVLPKVNNEIKNAIFIEAGVENGAIIDEKGFVNEWGLGTYGAIGNKLYTTTYIPTVVGREDVVLDTNNITIHPGETHQITVSNKTFNVLEDIIDTSVMDYISENSMIASVDTLGLVSGVKEGTTTVVVNKQGTNNTSIAQVTVLPDGINIEPMALTCGSHTVILKADGTVWSYGVNSSYELGDGTTVSKDIPVKVKFPDGVIIKQIAVGNTHNLALDTDGNVWGWGANSNNALGGTYKTPEKLGLSNIKKVVANNDQSMALTEDGYVYVWGLNSNGELGTRTYNTVEKPTLLTYVNEILDISLGKNHSLLLTTSGKVLASGSNVYGQTSKTEGKSNVFEEIKVSDLIGRIAAGDNHSVLLTVSGEIYTFGYNAKGQLANGNNSSVSTPTKILNMSNVMKISAGKNQTIVLTADRRLYSAGSNAQGELGIGTNEDKNEFNEITTVSDLMSISCGNTYNVAIRYNGDVYAWGDYYHGIQKVKTKTNSRIPVKIGNNSSYANETEITLSVNSTKQVNVTGKYIFNVYKENEIVDNFKYESINTDIATVSNTGLITAIKVGVTWVKVTEIDTGKENVIIVRVTEEGQKYMPQVAGGENYAAVLKSDGSIWSFGYNSDGQLGNDKLVPINIPSQINILSTYKKVIAGKNFTMALREDGTIWAWGDNTYGVLGQGNRVAANKPIQVQGISDVVDIAAGDNHVVAIDKIGNVYTWGLNSSGQLGNGTTKTETMPQKINILENQIVSISAGGNMTVFVDSEGKVYAFGSDSNPYFTKPQLLVGIENVVKAECMQNEIVVLKTDGSIEKIALFGTDMQTEKIASSNMIDISSKYLSTISLDVNGNMYTYGNNTEGQCGIGTTSTSESLQQANVQKGKKYIALGASYRNNYVIDEDGFVYSSGSNEYGQLGNSVYDDSTIFTLVGDRKFEIIPEARTMSQPEEETVTLKTNIFNAFNHNERKLTDYDWKSSNTDVATVVDGVITAEDMGEATITAVDKITGATSTALRVIQPLDEQRIDVIYVNGIEAKLIGENKYGVSVAPNLDGKATLKITTKDNTDSISIDQGITYSENGILLEDILLDEDPTVVKIRVKTSNNKTVDFILTIDVISNNSTLESLTVDGVKATPIGTNEYEIVVTNDVTNPEIIAITEDDAAKVSINNSTLEVKKTTKKIDMETKIKKVIPIEVVSENGNSTQYILTIYKEDALTELEKVTVNDVEATKINKDTYKIIVDDDIESSKVIATTVYPSAEVQINNLGADINVTTRIVSTIENQTVVKIYVTAKENERVFTLIIEKSISTEGLELLAVTVNGTLIEPIGNIYNAYVPANTTSVEVNAKTLNVNNLVSIASNAPEVYTSTKIVDVNGDTSYIISVIDSNDSSKKHDYTLNIKMPSSDNTLKLLSIGNSEYTQDAVRVVGTNIYEVAIPEEYTSINAIAIANSTLAYVSIDGNDFEINNSTRNINITGNPTDIAVKVKAQNGNIENYILRIYPKNGNKNLLKVTVDGHEATLSTTQKDTYEYTLEYATNIVNIGAIAEESRSSISINTYLEEKSATYRNVDMVGKSIVVNIRVTAEDGTQKEYKLIVNALPDNVKLLSVKVNGIEAKSVPTNKYETKVNKNETGFELYVIPEDPKAKVQIELNPEVVGTSSATITKNTEVVTVKIKVTAQDGTKQEYILVVSNQSDDCSIATIKVDGQVIVKDPINENYYYVTKKYLTKSVNVEATASNNISMVSINGLTPTIETQTADIQTPDDINYITVTITAEDGTTKEYIVVVEKLPNNTNADIQITMNDDYGVNYTKTITFDKNNKATVKVGNNDEVDITAILKDSLATVSINGNLPVIAKDTKTIITKQDKTIVTVEVVGQDGTQTNYIITLVRYSNDNELSELTAKGILNEDITKTSDNTYTIEIPDTMTSVELTAIANDKFATVKIEEEEYTSTNIKTQIIEMPDSERVISIIVKAENGDEKEYLVTIKKVFDLSLTSVKVESIECTVKNNTYIAFIDAGIEEVKLDITPTNPLVLLSTKCDYDVDFNTAQVKNLHTLQVKITSGEDTTVLIKLEDPNDSTRTKTYTVVIKEKSHEAEIEIIQVDGKDAINLISNYYAETSISTNIANIYVKATNEYATVEIIDNARGIGSVNKDITLSSEKITTLQIRVTAQDGITYNDYVLEIERKSDDTSCVITVNGVEPEEFDSSTNTYTKYVERGDTEATITVNTTSDTAEIEISGNIELKALVETVDIPNETNIVEIIVKAENGDTQIYYVNIIKKSDDDTIQTVKVNNVEVQEVDGKYNAIVYDNGENIQNALIEVTTTNKNAQVQIGDGTEWFTNVGTSTVTFKDGNRFISLNINVQAQDSNTAIATKILEIKLVSDDVGIKSVKNADVEVKNYDESTHTYTEYVDSSVEELTLAIEANSVYTTLTSDTSTGLGLMTIGNIDVKDKEIVTIKFIATAETGRTQEYSIVICKKSNNANASHVYVDGIDIIDKFTEVDSVPTYELSIGKEKDTSQIRVVAENKFATIQIADEKVGMEDVTSEIKLALSENSITVPIIIKSQDGTIIKTYNIIFVRLSNDTKIQKLEVNDKQIIEDSEGNYELTVKGSQEIATVKITLKDIMAKVTMGGNEEEGTLEETVILPKKGDTIKTITVTAQDGTVATYKLTIHKQENDLELDKVYLNGEIATKVDDTTFEIEVVEGVTNATIHAIAHNIAEYVSIKDNAMTIAKNTYENYDMTSKEVKIVVTAMFNNGKTEEIDEQKEYKLVIKTVRTISGKIITQAIAQANQSAMITVYKTSDLNPEEGSNTDEIIDTSSIVYRKIVKQININPDGTYAIPIEPGEYDIVITKTSYLEYRVTNIVVEKGKDVTLDDISILAGDIVKTGEIEIDDLTDLNDNIGVVITEDNKETKAIFDLNEDGVVDKLDRNILKKNYGKLTEVVEWINPDAISLMSLEDEVESIQTAIVEKNVQDFILPIECEYVITSEYGERVHPITEETKFHSGIDIVGEHHTKILAVADGEITYAGVQRGYGNCVEIKHIVNGETIYSFYAHLSQINVKVGQKVAQGETIGLEGGASTDPNPGSSTGHHLHFELRSNTGSGNSINPHNYIKF